MLENVWDAFGKWTHVKLANWCTEKQSPWYKAYKHNLTFIEKDILSSYFKKFVTIIESPLK